ALSAVLRLRVKGRRSLPYYPLPTSTVSGGNNFAQGLNDVSDSDHFMGRGDHRFNDKNSLFFRYSINEGNLTKRSAIPLNSQQTDAKTQNFALNYVRLLTPSTVNELRLGYNRPRYFNLQNGAYGPNIALQLGLKNLLNEPIGFGLPNVSVTN